jgi:hypothetical protein
MSLSWYWHRLRAMSPGEVVRHARKRIRQSSDARRTSWPSIDFTCPGVFPLLPKPGAAPGAVRAALRQDADKILAGHWIFFHHLEVRVDDPPRWQQDYLSGRDMTSTASAFDLNYRTLPDGTDSKPIWEPNRWSHLTRLAMAAFVLNDARAAGKCFDWLEDWVRHNPPYRGWNWTSALEAGLRLIQFAWIDALLERWLQAQPRLSDTDQPKVDRETSSQGTTAPASFASRLGNLRHAILPPHVWFVWRHRSFGSSANNHLLGELAGLIVALARWPGLVRCGISFDRLVPAWRAEVLAQFAPDGGNKEQALGYHLFSWELCWQALTALEGAGLSEGAASHRLTLAANFYQSVQVPPDPWDYGDSDNASVVPFFLSWNRLASEWHQWLSEPRSSPGLNYWLGISPFEAAPFKTEQPVGTHAHGDWVLYPDSGIAVARAGFWRLRWDLSPLGYLATAAHGHLDALHVSIWIKDVAMIIDPGTGAYHADKSLRHWLSSRSAHNGPNPLEPLFPERLGPFLWGEPHPVPRFKAQPSLSLGIIEWPGATMRRSIRSLPDESGWEVADAIERLAGGASRESHAFTVRWQFAPGAWVKRQDERVYEVHRGPVSLSLEVDSAWSAVDLVEPVPTPQREVHSNDSLEGIVSAHFRQTVRAPFLKLRAEPGAKPGIFTTTFRLTKPL